jgi:2-polyprenyl-3-methyl-5-hydroxy-6-metoxy-1,4-benzoquinol methylase
MNRTSSVKSLVKGVLPSPMWSLLRQGRAAADRMSRLFVYRQYDSSAYWRARAAGSGQGRVMWQNEEFNELYRGVQREILRPYVTSLPAHARVLDIGCGIGVVARMIVDLHPTADVDAVDFPEMVKAAEAEYAGDRIRYIASSAEEYLANDRRYDLVLSSGCFSAIRHVPTMESAVANAIEMLARPGLLIMIDPFHRWNYLARVKYSAREMIAFVEARGPRLMCKSGVLFWPYRDRLAGSTRRGADLARQFERGERWLRLLGQHAWADYKVLVFRQEGDSHSGRSPA